jgi:hypothetical protein
MGMKRWDPADFAIYLKLSLSDTDDDDGDIIVLRSTAGKRINAFDDFIHQFFGCINL